MTYPNWFTLGQCERMRLLQEANWTFFLDDPDSLLIIHGLRANTAAGIADTILLWKNDAAPSVLQRWRLGEGPNLHPQREQPHQPVVSRYGSIDEVLKEALRWLDAGVEADGP